MVRLDGDARGWAAGRRAERVRAGQAWLRRWVCACVCLGVGAARALTGGAGPSEEPTDPAWAAVGSLDVGGRLFSATLIGRQHVITAAHVVAGANPANIRFRSAAADGFSSAGTSVQVHPGYTGSSAHNSPGDPSVHADLAIVRLATPAPSAMPVARVFTGPVLGRVLTLVSHGGSTTLFTTGENRADVVFPDFLGRPATYLFDFDGPDLASNRLGPAVPANGTLGAEREATLANGDSGSAAFVRVDGRWYLAGVNTFNISFGAAGGARVAGTGGGGVVLGEQLEWIRGELERVPPVPGGRAP
ncbi:trypsin-like serine peptidase [Hydrogenophaga sp. PBL-H3]|uniref:trypsin-like serine peptidase n=1 Tax=Hydrogenophaga sp. PBL-H3 TaxID=434010 RepID=UPI0013599DF2|nr:trypsin-like serine protease [Hydrogenophaga sp. PBL-H3]